MSDKLQAFTAIPSTLEDSMRIGKVFFESGLFQDVKSMAQAVVKIQAGAEIGIPPFQAISNVHIIKGKPTIGAHLMAAKIKASGKYDYEVVKHDATICHIDFFTVVNGKRGNKIGESIMTIHEAQLLNSQNLHKMPRNMLFARAISNGQRWHCPDVFIGVVYVPEEMNDILDEDAKSSTKKSDVVVIDVDVLDPNNEQHAAQFGNLLGWYDWFIRSGISHLMEGSFDVEAQKNAVIDKFNTGTLTIEFANKTLAFLQEQQKAYSQPQTEY